MKIFIVYDNVKDNRTSIGCYRQCYSYGDDARLDDSIARAFHCGDDPETDATYIGWQGLYKPLSFISLYGCTPNGEGVTRGIWTFWGAPEHTYSLAEAIRAMDSSWNPLYKGLMRGQLRLRTELSSNLVWLGW